MTAARTEAPLLQIDGLQAQFAGPQGVVQAVDGVSLAVGRGRRLGVVGESGSGKTQTFFSIFGLSVGVPGVVAGRARFGDLELLEGLDRFVRPETPEANGLRGGVVKDVTGWNRYHQQRLSPIMGRDVAMMFQDPKRSLIPYWTVDHHLRDVLRRRPNSGSTGDEPTTLLSALGFRDTTRILTSYPEQLSGGEAQRALLAMTMAMRPQLLVADEPTTGLDTINQAVVLDALRQAQASAGFAMVLISHDLAAVDAMVDDVVVQFAGRVVERASATVVRTAADDALHPYTAALRDSQRRRAAGAAINPQAFRERLSRSPTGCAYQSRCSLRALLPSALQQQCAHEAPPLAVVGPEHAVACWGRGA